MDEQKQNFGISKLFSRFRIKPLPNTAINQDRVTQEFKDLLANFRKRSFELNSRWARIFNYNELLKNPETRETSVSVIEKGKRKGWLEVYDKRWIALRLALGLYNKLDEGPQAFYSSRQKFIARIGEHYPELGKKIELLTLPKQNEVLVILGPITGIINNPQLVESYIVTHYYELLQRTDKMKDQKLANRLRHIVVVLSDREKDELIRCINEVRSWPYRVDNDKRAATYGVPPIVYSIVERGFLFINGGKSRYDGESFWGFNMHFRDAELIGQLRSEPDIRRLMTYIEELKFFIDARDAIKKSVETEGKWEGFEDFYNNLKRGKNYIRRVRDKFQNKRLAETLDAFEGKMHESPVAWEQELNGISEEIRQSYRYIISSAESAFLRIFDAATKRLEAEKQTAIADLRKLMQEDNEMLKVKRLVLKIVGETRIQLRKELGEERAIFASLMESVLLLMPSIDLDFETSFNIEDSLHITTDMRNIFDRYIRWGGFASAHLRLLERPEDQLENDYTVRALTAAMSSFEKEATLAQRGIIKQDEMRDLNRMKYSVLVRAVRVLEEEIIPNIVKCEAHINSRSKFYTDKVDYYFRGTIRASKQTLKES